MCPVPPSLWSHPGAGLACAFPFLPVQFLKDWDNSKII